MFSKLLLDAGKFRLLLASMVVVVHTIGSPFGGAAVYLFFILSGYWIAHMWERQYASARQPHLTFAISRCWRIFPLYWLCYVLMLGVCQMTNRHDPVTWAHVLSPEWLARMTVLVGSAGQERILRPAWSLDYEMQFYLVAPWVVMALRGAAAQRAGWIGCVVLAGWFATGQGPLPQTVIHYGAFFLAGVLCRQGGWRPTPRLAQASAVVFLCMLLGLAGWHVGHRLGKLPVGLHESPWLNTIVVLAGFPLAVNSCHQTGDRFDRHLGNLAFPLYLSHDLVDVTFEQWLVGKGLAFKAAMLPVEWLLMAALAVAMYLWVDCPLEKLRQGFVARRRAPVVPAG